MTIIFRKEDFEQLSFKIVFLNLTSGTECKDFQLINAEEMSQDSMKLRVPNKSCNTKHNLMLLFYAGDFKNIPSKLPQKGDGKGIQLSITGKISDKKPDERNKEMAVIDFKFTQFESEKWFTFLEKYRERQTLINTTMDAIKSHGQ